MCSERCNIRCRQSDLREILNITPDLVRLVYIQSPVRILKVYEIYKF